MSITIITVRSTTFTFHVREVECKPCNYTMANDMLQGLCSFATHSQLTQGDKKYNYISKLHLFS